MLSAYIGVGGLLKALLSVSCEEPVMRDEVSSEMTVWTKKGSQPRGSTISTACLSGLCRSNSSKASGSSSSEASPSSVPVYSCCVKLKIEKGVSCVKKYLAGVSGTDRIAFA